jgi:small subunit ribosomal protein MRP21
MELRRVTTSLLRSQGSSLPILLSPSSTARWTTGIQLSCSSSPNGPMRRSLSTTTPLNSPKPTTTTTTPAPANSEETSTTHLEQAAQSLGWSMRPSRSRSSPFSEGGILTKEQRFNGGSSADSILGALNAQRFAPDSTYNRNSGGLDLSRMQDPAVGSLAPFRTADLMNDVGRDQWAALPKTVRVPMELKPSTGRTVKIGGNVDIGRGFTMLEQSCARNRIRADATKQRFHERGGLKRKRLRRQRWRKRFMEGFRATVGRVKHLRNQGW